MTQYLLDTQPGLALVLAETTNDDTTRYMHSPRGIHMIQDASENWHSVNLDGLGSVRNVVDGAGEVISAHNYTSYGVPDDAMTGFAFTGEQRDSNGLQYHRARYYAPELGLWANLDPLETDNRYGYVGGNVVNAIDSLGLCPENPWWNDIPGNRCVWLANELSQKYNIPRAVLMQKDVVELEGIYALGNANGTFNESAWSQTVRDDPKGAVVIAGAAAVGAGAIIATGGAAAPVVFGIAAGATAGAVTSGVIGSIPAGWIYDLAKSKKCGLAAKQWADSVNRDYFIAYASAQAATAGAITGGVAASGPVGVAVAGVGNAGMSALGGADALRKIVDALNRGDEVSACDAMNLALGVAGTALGIHGALRAIQGQQVNSRFMDLAKEKEAVCWECSSRALGGPKVMIAENIASDLEAAGFRQTRFPRPYAIDIWQKTIDMSPEPPYMQPYHSTIRLSWFWETLYGLSNNVTDRLTGYTPHGGIYDYGLLESWDPGLLNTSFVHYLPPQASLRYPYPYLSIPPFTNITNTCSGN